MAIVIGFGNQPPNMEQLSKEHHTNDMKKLEPGDFAIVKLLKDNTP